MAETCISSINNSLQKLDNFVKKREVFDPRVIDENDSSKALWTSESIELANKGLSEGYKLKDNPYLKTVRGALLRKAGLAFKYSEEELECLQASIEDKIWWANSFGKLKDGSKGWQNIVLRDYQEKILKSYDSNRWNILMLPRQSGKTTTTVLEIVHFCTFNYDKDCVVIAQSEKVVNEILTKIKECFAGLPFFMQPGFVSFTKKGFVLDNGCRLSIGVAAESVVQGFSLDLLFIDEFAYIRPSLVNSFWENIYPSLVNNPESRCIIASTPNGRNLFHTLWTGAVDKTNKFVPTRIYWTDVPGRDETFKRDTIANVGLNGWLMGFECSFDVGLKSVFSTRIQQQLRFLQKDYQNAWSKENYWAGMLYDIEFISQEYIQYDLAKDYFLLSIDIGEGLEQDSTVLKIKKIIWNIENKRLEYKTIGVYRDNTIAVEDFAEHFLKIEQLFDKSHIKVVVENNTYGGEFLAQIKNQILTQPTRFTNYSPDIFAKSQRNSKNDYEIGIRWNHFNKVAAVKSFSNLVSKGIFEETYSPTIEEYLNFGKQKNGAYAANYGHDDLTMADVTGAWFVSSSDMFAKQWLSEVETELRVIVHDEPIEIIRKREEEEQKKRNIYRYNGFEMRNHKDKLKMAEQEDLYLFSVE